MSSLSLEQSSIPNVVTLKRFNAMFLKEFVFAHMNPQIPVVEEFTRDSIKLPACVIVHHQESSLQMAGLDFLAGMYVGDYDHYATLPSPGIAEGVTATGRVEIDIVADEPLLRDQLSALVQAAYYAGEGKCWLLGHPEVCVVHGYNPRGYSETNWFHDLGSQVQTLYVGTLRLEFQFDIVTAKMLGYVREIQVVNPSQ